MANDGRKSSAEVRRQSLVNAAVSTPGVIHFSNYRRRRRAKVGGPVVSLDGGIILQRSYTNVKSVVSFMIYAGIMVRSFLQTIHRRSGENALVGLPPPHKQCRSGPRYCFALASNIIWNQILV